jgi:hypothetical protein
VLEHLFQAGGEQYIAHPAFELIMVCLDKLYLYPVGHLAKLEGELGPHDHQARVKSACPLPLATYPDLHHPSVRLIRSQGLHLVQGQARGLGDLMVIE